MVYDTLNSNFFQLNSIKFFRVCYQFGPLVKTLLSGRIQGLQVDLDPCQPWYAGYKLAPHKTQMQSRGLGLLSEQGADVN